jgi:transcriptional regulator with XRE-family HTH domain/Na+-transporting methylmalonyl-CoA/oxaloacetate decarboxylase gamma subunit
MQTIGERLEEARKRKGISIREAAEATRIRGDYLHKFESNQFDINLPEIYVRGFLRTYAGYLKLPVDKISADYNALGLGQPKPKGINRELYGRMELSVANAKEAAAAPEPAAGPAANPAQPAAEPPPRNPATFTPPRSSGPQIDRDLVIKGAGLVAGALVLIALLVWGITALVNSGGDQPAPAAGKTTANQRVITLVALDAIQVRVLHRNEDESEGAEIYSGTLARGQSQVVPWPGPIYIWSNARQNLEIDYQGARYPTGVTGPGNVRM